MSRATAIACCCLLGTPLLSCVSASVGGVRVTVPVAIPAGLIATELLDTERFFTRRRQQLRVVADEPARPPSYVEKEVLELLQETEKRLERDLKQKELLALADFFRAGFTDARRQLTEAPATARTAVAGGRPAMRPAVLRYGDSGAPVASRVRNPGKELVARSWADTVLDRLLRAILRVIEQAEDDDLVLDLCVESLPEDNAKLWIQPPYHPKHERTQRTNGRLTGVSRGIYAYRVRRLDYPEINCLAKKGALPEGCDPLDLVHFDRPLVRCFLAPQSAPGGDANCIVEEEPREGWTCAGSGA